MENPQRARLSPVSERGEAQEFDAWSVITQLLASVQGIADLRCWQTMLTGICASGLAMGMAQSSLAHDQTVWAAAQLATALFCTFYATNTVGIMMMDRAHGLAPRDVWVAVQDALGSAHRFILAILIVLGVMSLVLAALLGMLWLCNFGGVGAWLYALISPLIVVTLGLMGLIVAGIVIPLTAPTVWNGERTIESVRTLYWLVRKRFLVCILLSGLLAVLTALVGAIASALVFGSGWVMAQASLWVLPIDLPVPLLMSGLLGHPLGPLSPNAISSADLPYLYSSIVGGGVVFSLALVPPALFYIRGACAIYLELRKSRFEYLSQ